MKFALHSVSYSATWGGNVVLSFEEFLERARAFGYDAVEVMAKRPHISPVDYRHAVDRKRVYDLIAARGLEVACIADYHDWCWDAAHRDMPHHEKELLWLQANCELAADLHCPYVRTFSGYLHPEVSYQQQWAWCVDYLREGAEFAEKLGVTILLQPHQGFTVHYEDAMRMAEAVNHPHLQIQLDPPYVDAVGAPPEDAVATCADRLMYTVAGGHCSRQTMLHMGKRLYSGALRQTVHEIWAVSLDEAEEDTAGFFSALKRHGYKGQYIGYEICGMPRAGASLEVLDDMAKRSLAFMREAWDKA